jgi:hypothetical protein
MRDFNTQTVGGQGGQRTVGRIASGLASLVVAACASTGGGTSLGERIFGQSVDAGGVTTVQQDYPADFFLATGYCPPVEIRAGSEALVTYERGHDGERNFITYQGSIADTARECHALDAETLSIKVGIAGRVIAGPKGGAGNVNLPLRVAVIKQHGSNLFYTEALTVPVTLSAPDYGADFAQVFDQVVFKVTPDDRDLVVYVGFDLGLFPAPTG